MALRFSQADLKRMAGRAQSLSTRLAGLKRRTEKVTERVVHSSEIAAAAFSSGVINGKTGGVVILGVPLDLGLGLALNLGGYFNLAGDKMSNHLHGFGDGFLASYLTNLGREVGEKMNKGGGGTGYLETPTVRRVGVGSSGFTDAELASAVRAATIETPVAPVAVEPTGED
jgi:hypothetical protein